MTSRNMSPMPDPYKQVKPKTLEQRRRDLKGGDPEFYAYVSNFEAAKTLDSTGDALSVKREYGAANIVWSRSADAKAEYERMREEPK